MRMHMFSAAALMVVAMPFAAEALPVATAPAGAVSPSITLVAGICGPTMHRGPLGACRPNTVVVVVKPHVCRMVLLPLPHQVCR